MHTATQSKSEDKSESIAPGEYSWVRPGRFSAAWELMLGDEKIMTMSSPKSFGRMVYCDYQEKKFSVKKGGVRHPGAEVRLLSSETPALVLKQIDVHTVEFSGNKEFVLIRKELSNEWTLSDGNEVFMNALRDLTGKIPVGRITLSRELSPEAMAASWFMIFMDEIP